MGIRIVGLQAYCFLEFLNRLRVALLINQQPPQVVMRIGVVGIVLDSTAVFRDRTLRISVALVGCCLAKMTLGTRRDDGS